MIIIVSLLLTIGAALFYIGAISFQVILLGSSVFAFLVFLYFRTIRAGIFCVSIVFFVCMGALILKVSIRDVPFSFFGTHTISGVIKSVDRRLDSSVLIVEESETKLAIRVSLPSVTPYLPGDTVSLSGDILPPEDFITDTERIFPYQKFLEAKKVYGVVRSPKEIQIVSEKITPTRLATKVRFFVADTFAAYVSFPYDGIVSGMLVGYQGGIPKNIETLFRETGTIHVLVLSGYNIMLLAGACMLVLKRVPYTLRFFLTICAITFLVMVSGSGVAAVRAGIMGSLSLFAGLLFRQYDPIRALFLCFIFFFFWSPVSIFVDPGLHLSFLATFCMLAVVPKIESLVSFIPKTKFLDIRELTVLSLTLPFVMLPYTLYFAGFVSLSTIIANMLLSVVIPIVMILGGIIFISSCIPVVAMVFGVLLSTILSFVVKVLSVFSLLPTQNTPAFSAWSVLCIYILFFGLFFRKEIFSFMQHLQKSFRQLPSSFEK